MDPLILIQSVEATRCLEEKLLSRALDGDVGSLLGWGYLAFRGGPLAWIDPTVSISSWRHAKRLPGRIRATHRRNS